MAQAIRSILIRCSVLCRITVGRPLRTLSRRPALQLMQAIPTSLLPLLTISEALLSFAYLEAGSISVQSRHSRNARVRLQDRGQRLRAKPQRAECKDCHWLIWHLDVAAVTRASRIVRTATFSVYFQRQSFLRTGQAQKPERD